MTRKTATRAGAAFFAVPAALMMASGPALAAEGGVSVSNSRSARSTSPASSARPASCTWNQDA